MLARFRRTNRDERYNDDFTRDLAPVEEYDWGGGGRGRGRGRGRGNGGRGRGRGHKRWIDGYYTGRMYGRFRCAGCNKKWESSNVYMVEGEEGVYYEQQCKACHTSMQPYQAEPIRCRQCGEENCICDDFEERHVNANKPHRSDLCGRCKSGRPCRQGQGHVYTDTYTDYY